MGINKQVKQVSPMQRILILGIFVIVIIGSLPLTYAQTLVPANASQINTWFQAAIKPLSQRDGLRSNVVEAENSVEVIYVSQDGNQEYSTIQEALDSLEGGGSSRIILYIGGGEYEEKITIEGSMPYITLYGDPNDKPVISYDGTAADYGTVDSSTLTVLGDYFVASNIIIKNSAPRPDGVRKGAQAVALRVTGDKATFYNCQFIGFQDTICDDKGRHFFKDCYIEGTVDFLFGSGRSLYLSTELHVISGDAMAVIAAHARKTLDGQGGFSFVHCKVTGRGSNALLGRAWFKAGRVVYSYCELSDVVKPKGWSDNSNPGMRETLFFGEYKNSGAGSDTSKRVSFAKQLSDEEVQDFISLEYIDAAQWLLPPPSV